MSQIIEAEIDRYSEEHSTPPDPHLAALAQETRDTLPESKMLSGNVTGRFLETLVFISGARRVLEIGTFSGYSALSMAGGLPPDGHIVSCELDPVTADVARCHVAASEHAGRIEVRVGPAAQTLQELPGPFDLAFVDADKQGYLDYYESILPKLSERGLIVFDNTLWGGDVLDASDPSPTTRALIEFNEHVRTDTRTTCVLVPVRDGITLVRRSVSR